MRLSPDLNVVVKNNYSRLRFYSRIILNLPWGKATSMNLCRFDVGLSRILAGGVK